MGTVPVSGGRPIEAGLLPLSVTASGSSACRLPACRGTSQPQLRHLPRTLRSKWGLSPFPENAAETSAWKKGTVPFFTPRRAVPRRPDRFHGLTQCTYGICDALSRGAIAGLNADRELAYEMVRMTSMGPSTRAASD